MNHSKWLLVKEQNTNMKDTVRSVLYMSPFAVVTNY